MKAGTISFSFPSPSSFSSLLLRPLLPWPLFSSFSIHFSSPSFSLFASFSRPSIFPHSPTSTDQVSFSMFCKSSKNDTKTQKEGLIARSRSGRRTQHWDLLFSSPTITPLYPLTPFFHDGCIMIMMMMTMIIHAGWLFFHSFHIFAKEEHGNQPT